MNSQMTIFLIVRRASPRRAARVALEYAVTISLAVLASYLILGGHWH